MIQTLDLFPQKIGLFRYEGDLSLYVDEIYKIKSQVNNSVKHFPQELIYQTPMDLFSKYSIFYPLKEFIQKNLETFYSQKFKFLDSWANVYPKYGYSYYHTHGDADISGVVYLKTPKNDNLFIYNRMNNGQIFKILPTNGDIIFFSGNQPHNTHPNLSQDDKIIIAFNLRFLEEYKKLTYL